MEEWAEEGSTRRSASRVQGYPSSEFWVCRYFISSRLEWRLTLVVFNKSFYVFMTYPWVTFIKLHTREIPQYGHNRTTAHWAAPLERLGIKRFSQGQPSSPDRMKGFCFTIDFFSFLLSFFWCVNRQGAEALHQERRVHFLNTTSLFTVLYSELPKVCVCVRVWGSTPSRV